MYTSACAYFTMPCWSRQSPCVCVAIVVILIVLLDVPREHKRVTHRDRGREDENEVYGIAAEKVMPDREGKE
jgi:hypothetical protein